MSRSKNSSLMLSASGNNFFSALSIWLCIKTWNMSLGGFLMKKRTIFFCCQPIVKNVIKECFFCFFIIVLSNKLKSFFVFFNTTVFFSFTFQSWTWQDLRKCWSPPNCGQTRTTRSTSTGSGSSSLASSRSDCWSCSMQKFMPT